MTLVLKDSSKYIRTLSMSLQMRGKLVLGDLGGKPLSFMKVGVVKDVLCLRL